MKYLKAALATATLGCITSAFAGAGDINTTVISLQDQVTYAKSASGKEPALVTKVGYSVSITNAGGNTINNIRFAGTISTKDPSEPVTFSSSEGAICEVKTPLPGSIPPPGSTISTAIECTIGQLTASRDANFAVFFLAPQDTNTAVANSVQFFGSTIYGEGFGGANSVPDNSISEWICYASPDQVPDPLPDPILDNPASLNACNVLLGTPNATKIRSSVTKNGGDLFTGDGAITTTGDRFSTIVRIPPGQAYTTAVINETQNGGVCNGLVACDQTQLTIPLPVGGFTPYLTIILRQDATNITRGAKINEIVLWYESDEGLQTQISDCATGPVAGLVPCIVPNGRKVWSNKDRRDPNYTPELDGDYQWTLISLKNGTITYRPR